MQMGDTHGLGGDGVRFGRQLCLPCVLALSRFCPHWFPKCCCWEFYHRAIGTDPRHNKRRCNQTHARS